jgi:putative zinc- or iron-chelating protein
VVSPDLDAVWIACAARMDLPVARGGEAYVHFDGRTLWIAGGEHLDSDDTLAQLVLHEICHMAVQGPATRHAPDWGLDNTTDRDVERERAAVRLQAHLCGAFGLRGALYPTTEVRAYFEAMPADPLAGPEPSAAMARVAAVRIAREPFAPALNEALEETARLLAVPRHRSGHAPVPDGDARTCGTCVWRGSGRCRQATRPVRVAAAARACVRHEAALICADCGACCRSAYDVVPVGPREVARRRHPALVAVLGDGSFALSRRGDRCAALEGPEAGPCRCRIYADRPRACRDLEVAGRHCLTARRRVGLTL